MSIRLFRVKSTYGTQNEDNIQGRLIKKILPVFGRKQLFFDQAI